MNPPFKVPPHLIADIKDRPAPPRKKPGPPPTYTKAQLKRNRLKARMRELHSHRIHAWIAKLEERLAVLIEIRDELNEG